jgi:DNA-binding LacI/PurR family transcriptional regulator
MDPALQVDAESSEDAGYAAARTLLERGLPFDAVFAASDLIAIGAMRALAEQRLRIPEDVSVVGFDDIPMARFANPPLTTVYQNTQRAGEILVDALLRQIRDEPVESQMIPASLIVRKSSGSVALVDEITE